MTKHYAPRPKHALPAGSRNNPVVAVVGRPNVGKSTLFNRLARAKLAIVHDEPGVTRDRHYADVMGFGRSYTLVDTGGFDPESDDPMKAGIAKHVRAAIAEADVIVFVTDTQTDLSDTDRACIELLRRTDKPVLYAANKADSPRVDGDAFDLYRYGVKEVLPVSALHGRGIGELEAAIVAALPAEAEAAPEGEAEIPRIAIIGRPNAGKSSWLNRLLGENRMLVDDKPGTTRDAIDALVTHDGASYVFVDTAGLRRKSKVLKAEDSIETMSVLQAVRAIERSEIVILMCDAAEGVAEQDAKILGLAEERGRALIVALNKSDLLSADERKKAEERARDKLTFAPYAPILHLSAKTGRGRSTLLSEIARVAQAYRHRVTTGELNRFFEQVLETRTPPTMGGKAPRLYFITQAESCPPAFVVVTTDPEAIHFSYQRFIVNQLRERFGFHGVPIRLLLRAKRKRERPAWSIERAAQAPRRREK